MYYAINFLDFTFLIIIVACIFMIGLQKPNYSQKTMTNLCFWTLILASGYCIKVSATSLDALVIGQKMTYISGLFVYYYFLLFIFHYCHKELPDWLKVLLMTNNSTLGTFVLFFNRHQLFYKSYRAVRYDSFLILNKTNGPLHTIISAELALYCLAMIGVIVYLMITNKTYCNISSFLLIIAVSCPIIFFFVQRFLNTPVEFISIGCLITTFIMIYLIYIGKIYDVTDVALDFIFDNINSGIIMTDENYHYKGSNKLAEKIFPEIKNINFDQNIYVSSSQLRQIINGNTDKINFEDKVYEPSIENILKDNNITGYVIWLDDVTAQFEFMALQDSYREELEAEVEKQTQYAKERHLKLEQMSRQLVQTLANTIDAKDKYTNGHSTRVAEYSVKLADALGWDQESIEILRYEGLLHDIGKIGVPDTILNKPSGLTDSEFNIIQSHTIVGSGIIHDTTSLPGCENVIRHHHEKFDGTGYPLHLKGEQIPLDARIVGIADSFDAMSSNRIYRKALPKSVIREELLKGRGTQFDPKLLDAFLVLFDRGDFDDIAPADNGWK